MKYNGMLLRLPREIRWFIAIFVITLSVGFFSGLFFVEQTSTASPSGIEENYLGNEQDVEAEIMIFKKSQREMLTLIHTHILSLSMLFFLMGILVWGTRLPRALKMFLAIEPFLSLILTFGGIYLLWYGILWMKYLVSFSGMLMTVTYALSSGLVVFQCLWASKTTP